MNPSVAGSASAEIGRQSTWVAGDRWRVARPWQTNAALLLLGLFLFLLSRHLSFEYEDYTIGFSGTSGWSIWCYLLAAFIALTQPTDRFTFPIILGVAMACRLAVLFTDPYLSSDIFRYVWDGIVQHAGINPYRYVPADPALAFLREASDGNIYPAINRATYAHTIYPPFAQMYFWLVTFISPTLTMMKTAMVLCEGVTAWSLVWLLRALGRPREQLILYAWAPVVIWEISGSGHLDSLAMALIGLALVARYKQRPVWTGCFLALAVLTKMYPLVLFPALYMRHTADRRTGQPSRSLNWSMPATMLALAVVGYGLYSSVGRGVTGFLNVYLREEGMTTGARYFLLDLAQRIPGLHSLSTGAFLGFAAIVFALLTCWAWTRSSPANLASRGGGEETLAQQLAPHGSAAFLPPALALAGALMLLFSPHYAWYVIWLLPFLTLLPNLPTLIYVMGFQYIYSTLLGTPGPLMFLGNKILYGGVTGAMGLMLLSRRVPALRISWWRAQQMKDISTSA